VLPNASMPHVLWQLQDAQQAVFSADEHGVQEFEGFEVVRPGSSRRARSTMSFATSSTLEYIGSR
jgi:hypothetical protein